MSVTATEYDVIVVLVAGQHWPLTYIIGLPGGPN